MTLVVQGAILGTVLSQDPSFTVWSRFEPLPLDPDLRPGLQARIADPLWLVGRQWQFRELTGEDAGSPVEARVSGESIPLTRFAPGPLDDGSAERARDFEPAIPLEVQVEREPARAGSARLAAEAGLHFLRCLTAEGAGQQRTKYLTSPFLLDDITPADPDGVAWATLLNGRALDGRRLAAAFRPFANADYVLSALPDEPAIPQGMQVRVRRAAGRFLRWYDESIHDPEDVNDSWNPARQEYAFAIGAHLPDGPVVLHADEYADGRIDGYSFRASAGPALGEAVGAAAITPPPLLPAPVRYPGMPADRYWEFEDARVSFGAVQAGRTDLLQMLLIEFALAYGNDWFLIPLTLPVGSLFRMTTFTVRDTFGVEIPIGRSRDEGGVPWRVFELSCAPDAPAYLRDLFLLPPTVPLPLAGDPIEEVALFRDEMANVCWSVERKVQGSAGSTVDRYLEASRTPVHQRLVEPPDDARLIYRLATPVPEHWIPFVPVRAMAGADPAGVQLERRVLLRFDADGSVRESHPHGALLRANPSVPAAEEAPLRLHEEEVPREGVVVRRMFQYARDAAGRAHLWLGRDKRVGTGEGSSLLRFDVAERRGG